MTETTRVESRWTDKLVGTMAIVIGALVTIVWGIVWHDVSDHSVRLNALESDKRVFEEKLKTMDLKLDKIDIKLDRVVEKK